MAQPHKCIKYKTTTAILEHTNLGTQYQNRKYNINCIQSSFRKTYVAEYQYYHNFIIKMQRAYAFI